MRLFNFPNAPLAAFLLLGAASVARADVVWRCWYDRTEPTEQVACVLAQPSVSNPMSATTPIGRALGTARPQPGRLPGLAGVVQHDPELLQGQIIHIPLHWAPADHQHVGELAQAVMCGLQRACRALYSERPASDLATTSAISDATDVLRNMR